MLSSLTKILSVGAVATMALIGAPGVVVANTAATATVE